MERDGDHKRGRPQAAHGAARRPRSGAQGPPRVAGGGLGRSPKLTMLARDLFLARDLTEAEAQQYLAAHGFRDPAAADDQLQQLADDLPTRLALGELAGLLIETLTEAPDPDAAVVGFCRYVAYRFPKSSFIGYLQDDPRTLQILTRLLGASPTLGEILIRNPEHLHWLHRELDCPPPDLDDYQAEVGQILAQDTDVEHRLDMLKRFQRRETLRIAGRDLLDKDTLRSTTEQLSNLADIVTGSVLRVVRDELAESAGGAFVVIGTGRLGGRELSYSPDIDLFCVYEADDPTDRAADAYFQNLGRALTFSLTAQTSAGYLYRLGGGLRPAGEQGEVTASVQRSTQYCARLAEQPDRFPLIKMRPIAGDLALGRRFLDLVRPIVYRAQPDQAALAALARRELQAAREHAGPEAAERNVTIGPGGSRDVELAVQLLQLLHGERRPDLQEEGNTLAALARLQAHGLVDDTLGESLVEAYSFLRTVEHRLQIGEDAQTPLLPAAAAQLEITARRTGFASAADLEAALTRHRGRVRDGCAHLLDRASAGS